MKIIVIENNYIKNNIRQSSTLLSLDSPIVYTLPDTALLKDHRPFFVPEFAQPCTCQLHLVARICRLGRSISARFADRYFDALSVGVTFTAENILNEVKSKGLPWELAKGFDGSAALGSFIPVDDLTTTENICFHLQVGEETVQSGMTSNMVWKINELIAYLSQYYTFKQGDFLYTGCPAPMTEVRPNTKISGFIGDKKVLYFNIK